MFIYIAIYIHCIFFFLYFFFDIFGRGGPVKSFALLTAKKA